MRTHTLRHESIEDKRVYWECSCGNSGSAYEWKWELHSDWHVNYDLGDKRVDSDKGVSDPW